LSFGASFSAFARLEWRVEMSNEGAQTQPLRLITADQHAVRALIRHHFDGGTLGRGRALVERVHHADDLGRAGVLQRHDLHVLVPHLVDSPDDAHHAVHVARAVGDDEDVGGRVGDQVAVLRDHRPQDRHERGRAHVADIEHLGDDLIRGGAHPVGKVDRRDLPRVGIGQDLHHVAGGHRDEPVHLQDREERLVEGVRGHRRRGEHRHLRAHARVDDEVLAGGSADRFGDLRDVRVLEIRRDALRLLRRGERSAQHDRERAHRKRAKSCH